MADKRQYESAMVFNARIVDLRHLWVPANEYKGKPQEKPSWFSAFIIPKTRAGWHEEPLLAGATQALGNLYNNNPQIVDWPILDGDKPNREGKTSDWAKGHWVFSGSTSNQPKVEIVQPGGQLALLQNKVGGVKAGDFCMVGLTAAVKQNDPRAAKFFLNTVVFTAAGEEIVFANQVSGAEMVAAAAAQGFQVQGYTPSGYGGAPQGAGGPFGGGGQPQGGFPGGGAPTQGGPAFGAQAGGSATGQFATGAPGSGSAFPSNGQPGGYGAPASPFGGGGQQQRGPFG